MIQKNSIVQNDPMYPIRESYLSSSWNSLKHRVSELANFVFSRLYAVYDFPRSTNPVTQQREFRWVPTFMEQAIGEAAYPGLLKESGRVVKETNTIFGNYSKLVHEIGKELTAKCPRNDLSFEFEVVENSQDNAWCLPGGKIAINIGLIRNMEEEKNTFGMDRSFTLNEKIAAVLSHEITHATARHGGRTIELRCLLFSIFKVVQFTINFFLCRHFNTQIQELEKIKVKTEEQQTKIAQLHEKRDSVSNTVFRLFDFIAYQWILTYCNLCTSRSHEFEADKYGMHLIHKVGSEYNKIGLNENSAEAAVWLQHYFKETRSTISTGWLRRIKNLFSTHPSSEQRIAANQKTWQELRTTA